MPSLAEIKYEDLDQLHKAANDEYLARSMAIGKRQEYYNGNHKKWLIDPLTKKPTSQNVTVNVTQKIVDQSVSMLFGGDLVIKTGNDALDAVVEAMEDYNFDEAFYTSLAASGSIGGHCYVKIMQDESGIRWVMLNPSLVSVFWSPSDLRDVIAYKIQWSEGATEYRQDIIKDGATWIMRDLQREKSGQWKITNDQVWEYEFAPIVDWQNLPNFTGYYGKSDLTALELNDAINFVSSNINAILYYHAHPRTIGTGVRADQVKQTAVNGFYAIENNDAKVYNLEMESDLSSSQSYLAFLRNEFFSQQRAVDIQSVKDKVGQLTNFGLRVLFSDAIQKNATKQILYGYGIKELIYRSLVIAGANVEARNINVEFVDPMPVNDLENANRIKTQIESGITSRQTGAEEMGYDWITEASRMASERAEQSASIGNALMDAIRATDAAELENA